MSLSIKNTCISCGIGLYDYHNDDAWYKHYGTCRYHLKNWGRLEMCIEEKKVKDCTRAELETYLADQDIEEAFNKLAGVIKELKDKGFHFTVNKKSKSRGVEL